MRLVKSTLLLGALLSVLIFAGVAQATALGPIVDLEQPGLSMAVGGAGLHNIGTGVEIIDVNIGGDVVQALLYWTGRERPCDQDGAGNCHIPAIPSPYKDQVLKFDGTIVTGNIVGAESQLVGGQGQDIHNIGFGLDVTSIVQAKFTTAGLYSFPIADGDTSSNLSTLNGAGLLVIYTDPSETATYRIQVSEGLDFAFAEVLGL